MVFAYHLSDAGPKSGTNAACEPGPGDRETDCGGQATIEVPWLDADARYEVRDVTPGRSSGPSSEPTEMVGTSLAWPGGDPPSAAVWILTRL